MNSVEGIVLPVPPEAGRVGRLIDEARANFDRACVSYPECPAIYRDGKVVARFDFERQEHEPHLCVTLEFLHSKRIFQHHMGWRFGDGRRHLPTPRAVRDWLASAYDEITVENRRRAAMVAERP